MWVWEFLKFERGAAPSYPGECAFPPRGNLHLLDCSDFPPFVEIILDFQHVLFWELFFFVIQANADSAGGITEPAWMLNCPLGGILKLKIRFPRHPNCHAKSDLSLAGICVGFDIINMTPKSILRMFGFLSGGIPSPQGNTYFSPGGVCISLLVRRPMGNFSNSPSWHALGLLGLALPRHLVFRPNPHLDSFRLQNFAFCN